MNFFKGLEKFIVLSLLLVSSKVIGTFVGGLIALPVYSIGIPALTQGISLILSNLFPVLLLLFFWKRWKNVGTLIWGAVLCVLMILFSLLLTQTSDRVGGNFIFMLAIISFPLYFASPVILVATLLYARFRGLLKNENMPTTTNLLSQDPEVKTLVSRQKNRLAAIFAIVALTPIYLLVHFFTQPDHTDRKVENSALEGKKYVFSRPMYYSMNCTRCGGSPNELKINRSLECLSDGNGFSDYLYKDGYMDIEYVPSNTEFTVVEESNVDSHGLASIDSSGYGLVTLKDPQGRLSTTGSYSLKDGEICTNSHMLEDDAAPLFAYIEQAGKITIIANLYNGSLQTSTPEMQDEFITKLPEKYKKGISNIEKIPTPYKNLYGVRMTVDADALAFLTEEKLDHKIYSLYGDDPAFQAWLRSHQQEAYKWGLNPQENRAATNLSYAPKIATTPRIVGGSLDMDAIVNPGKSIHVRSVDMPVPGFLLIYAMGGYDFTTKTTTPAKVYGVSELLPVGKTQNFDVLLSEEVRCTGGIVARLYKDVGNDGKFDINKEEDPDGTAWIVDAKYNMSVSQSFEVKCR